MLNWVPSLLDYCLEWSLDVFDLAEGGPVISIKVFSAFGLAVP